MCCQAKWTPLLLHYSWVFPWHLTQSLAYSRYSGSKFRMHNSMNNGMKTLVLFISLSIIYYWILNGFLNLLRAHWHKEKDIYIGTTSCKFYLGYTSQSILQPSLSHKGLLVFFIYSDNKSCQEKTVHLRSGKIILERNII